MLIHIKAGARQPSLLQGLGQRRFIHYRSACSIDEIG